MNGLKVLLLALAVCAFVLIGAASAAGEEEVARLKKMTVKQLKQWLQQRDIPFDDITEKSEFITRASDWLARSAASNSATKVAVPTEPFWTVWSGKAKAICDGAIAKKSLGDSGVKVCDSIQAAVESLFMQQGKRTAAKLKKKPEHLTKTAHGDIYSKAAVRLLNRVVGYCLSEKNVATCGSSSSLLKLLEGDKIPGVSLSAWITNVGIENTNPMFEITAAKPEKDEL